jgi:hypothetical protein
MKTELVPPEVKAGAVSLGVVNFETPYLVVHCLNSFRAKHPALKGAARLLLYDNSITSDSEKFFKENNIHFYPRSDFQQIKRGDGTDHAAAVRQLIENCKTEWLILVDSDVEFTGSIASLLKGDTVMTGKIEYGMKDFTWENNGPPRNLFDRFYAYFIVINVRIFKTFYLYFNSDSIWPEKTSDLNIDGHVRFYHKYFNTVFDVGAYAYYQALKLGLRMDYVDGNIHEGIPEQNSINKYVNHISSASWMDKGSEGKMRNKYENNKEVIEKINKFYIE